VYGETGDRSLVALEVPDERVIVGCKISDRIYSTGIISCQRTHVLSGRKGTLEGRSCTVLLCAGIYYTRAGVCELGKLDAVLLAQEALIVAPLLDVVYLDRLVAGGRHDQLAFVVVVDGLDVRLRAAVLDVVASEELHGTSEPTPQCRLATRYAHTLVGRNAEITSLRFDVALLVPPSDLWMLRDGVKDAPTSGRSTSMGVDAMV
jgi:hypothetical protein